MCNFNGPQTFTKMCGYPVKISHQFKPLAIVSLLLLLGAGSLFAQDQGKYIYGDEQRLQIVVHVLGEVKRPGEYIVPDNTDIVEIISKAGGTTEFSNLGSVFITRYHRPGHAVYGPGDPDRKQSELSRVGGAAADTQLGQHAQPGPRLHAAGLVGYCLPRPGYFRDGDGF